MQGELKVNPAMRYVIGGAIAFVVGLILVIQPWATLLRPVGALPMLAGLMLVTIMYRRVRQFDHMRKHIIARFEEGIVMDGGALHGGQIHFLTDTGVRLERCEIDDGKLYIGYAFYARKKREHVEMDFTLPKGDEAAMEAAQAVIKRYGLLEAPKEETMEDDPPEGLPEEIDVQ